MSRPFRWNLWAPDYADTRLDEDGYQRAGEWVEYVDERGAHVYCAPLTVHPEGDRYQRLSRTILDLMEPNTAHGELG